MKKTKSFYRQTKAFLKGDTDQALIEANYRTATSFAEVQIAGLKAKIVAAEFELTEKREELQKAKFPTERIKDSSRYLSNIQNALSAVESAEESLKELKESKQMYEDLIKEFDEEVEDIHIEEKK